MNAINKCLYKNWSCSVKIFLFSSKEKKKNSVKQAFYANVHHHPPLGDDKLFSVLQPGCTEIILPSLTGELCGTWSCLSKWGKHNGTGFALFWWGDSHCFSLFVKKQTKKTPNKPKHPNSLCILVCWWVIMISWFYGCFLTFKPTFFLPQHWCPLTIFESI